MYCPRMKADFVRSVCDNQHLHTAIVLAFFFSSAFQVPKLMEFLRLRSLRPGLGKLPIVPVIVVVDPDDPRCRAAPESMP